MQALVLEGSPANVRRSRSTHWKQTVLYLEETIVICEGETISGAACWQPSLTVHSSVAALLAVCRA